MKIAFAFCSDVKFLRGLDKLYQTLIMHNSFLSSNNFDFILLTDDVFKYKNFKIINCSDIKINTHVKRFSKTFYKFKAFDLTEYDRVIFIDSDILCLGDISFLISEELHLPFYAAKDDGINLNFNKDINSGVMVINKPILSNETFKELILLSKKGFDKKHFDKNGNGSDQMVINSFIKNYKYGILDMKYNTLKRIYYHHKEIWNKIKNDIRLLHFVGEKPWFENKDPKYKELDDMWSIH